MHSQRFCLGKKNFYISLTHGREMFGEFGMYEAPSHANRGLDLKPSPLSLLAIVRVVFTLLYIDGLAVIGIIGPISIALLAHLILLALLFVTPLVLFRHLLLLAIPIILR